MNLAVFAILLWIGVYGDDEVNNFDSINVRRTFIFLSGMVIDCT
jgi:hypothetical protein